MQPFLTGTRAYGPVREDSDWDIVMEIEAAKTLYEMLRVLNVKIRPTRPHIGEAEYESGWSFRFNGRTVQIIEALPDDMFSWRYATAQMQKLDPIESREDRVGLFTDFRRDMEKVIWKDKAIN